MELLLDVDSEEPLEGFMACGRRAEWARAELHRPDDLSGRANAWHQVSVSCWVKRRRQRGWNVVVR